MRRVVLGLPLLLAGSVLAGAATSPDHPATQRVPSLGELPELAPNELMDRIQLAASSCGVERWNVKVGLDSDKREVDLQTVYYRSIGQLRAIPKPTKLPANERVGSTERRVFQFVGTLTDYKRESDSDYHLVVKDTEGRSLIVELPTPGCMGALGQSPFRTKATEARKAFDAKFTATSSFKTTSTKITIRGVGYFDHLHGQRGVAPNGIEIHPVLGIKIG